MAFKDYNETIEFLSDNSIYPAINKNKKIYLIGKKKNLLSDSIESEIINILNIKNEEDVKRVKDEINQNRKSKGKKPIKEWSKEERPRERLIQEGAENLTNIQLLSILLRTGTRSKSAQGLAAQIMGKYKNLREIDKAPVEELLKIEGLGIAKIAQIKAAFEIGRRFIREELKKEVKIRKPEDVILFVKDVFYPYLRDEDKEFFYVILLDIKNKILDKIEISKGSVYGTIVDPKEILKLASLKTASSVILIHNHPSGEPIPSEDDINLTHRIKEILEIAGIRVLDHIIIGRNVEDFYSFSRNGLLK